jgi:diketogulonate reductase-like aldo/keto reductase
VALNWVVSQPGVTATIIGATTVAQLDANLAALAFDLPPDARARLNDASKLDLIHPYTFFEAPTQERIKGGVAVRAWVPAPSAGPR